MCCYISSIFTSSLTINYIPIWYGLVIDPSPLIINTLESKYTTGRTANPNSDSSE